MKGIICGLAMVSILGCTQNWDQPHFPQRVVLENIAPLPGGHCESSALYNDLIRLGYPVSEAMVVGAGGAMGFIYQGGSFPFIGGRSLTMKETFFQSTGIPWQVGDNSSEESAWAGVVDVLQRGLPVILRVDMRYLPYLYGGKYGSKHMSFGWHIICLYGIDFEKQIAYVSDTDRRGIQEIQLKDLHRARFSRTPFLTPQGEYYWAEEKPEGFQLNWQTMVERSAAAWLENYRSGGELNWPESPEIGGLHGLEQLPHVLSTMDDHVKSYLLSPVLINFHGWIEEYGTGGAAFRQFTRDYLAEAQNHLDDPRILEGIALLDESIAAWHDLSAELLRIGNAMKSERDPLERQKMLQGAAERASILYNREEAFYLYLQNNWEN